MPYGPHTADDRARMLGALGLTSVDQLFEDIPVALRASHLDLPDPEPELELAARLSGLAARNRTDLASFLGAGVYRHWSPPAVDQLLLRGEWYTAYTPYQPEISQGTLQSIYEYESLLAELVDLDVVSASHYDGAAATAEAALMTCRATRRERVLISRGVHPHYRETTRTYFKGGLELEEIPLVTEGEAAGTTDLAALERMLAEPGRPVAGVIAAQPDFLGLLEPMPEIGRLAHAAGALFVAVVEPVSLAVLAPPGAYGADIAAGEGQPLGIAPQYGGPYLGILASTDALVRQIPGRLVGMTTDLDGRRAFVMTMRAREQDIRRDKAASNICTNQALLALAASIYLATIGPHGLRDVAALGASKAAELEAALAAVGAERLHPGAYLNEFVVRVPDARTVHRRLLDDGVLAGLVLADAEPDDPSLADGLLVCATEVTTSAEIVRFAGAMSAVLGHTDIPGRGSMSVTGERLQPTIFERGRPGRGGGKIPHPPKDALDRIPVAARRTTGPALPEMNEPDVVRHYVNLSQLNYAVDTGFYPLGSCTMKFNPKLNEWAARLPGFANLHPMAPDEIAQGTLQLLWELEHDLAEISGMRAVSLQPAAGAQGELTGILMIRAYHRARGEADRDEVLVPDSSHGTNPATASMAGYRTITVPSAADGGVDLDAFRAALGPRTAAVMITNPSTLGLFEARIGELLDAVHAAGALAYMDGANLNAILGRFKPGEAGFDVMHFNVHKTFSTPHGGGGPGAGPVGVGEILVPYLPSPRVLRNDDGTFRLERDGERPTSIGRLRSFVGNTGVLVRAYAYIRAHGGPGLREVSDDAVLAANYLKHRLAGTYDIPYDRACKHEFVASAATIKKRTGVRTLDIAKRLIDYGYHPPTIYFPLIVEEGMLIEPTETESVETLDAFADALIAIAAETDATPELVTSAPHSAPVRRLDEAMAARQPNLRWRAMAGDVMPCPD